MNPIASPVSPDIAAPPTPNAAIEPAPRYLVRAVLWGNRKRFVVRDTTTDTTVAIRTTRQIADSDIIRLNMAPRTDHGPRPQARPVQADTSSAERDRQCGRCRRHFAPEQALEPNAIQDWWLCEACAGKLLGSGKAGSD